MNGSSLKWVSGELFLASWILLAGVSFVKHKIDDVRLKRWKKNKMPKLLEEANRVKPGPLPFKTGPFVIPEQRKV